MQHAHVAASALSLAGSPCSRCAVLMLRLVHAVSPSHFCRHPRDRLGRHCPHCSTLIGCTSTELLFSAAEARGSHEMLGARSGGRSRAPAGDRRPRSCCCCWCQVIALEARELMGMRSGGGARGLTAAQRGSRPATDPRKRGWSYTRRRAGQAPPREAPWGSGA